MMCHSKVVLIAATIFTQFSTILGQSPCNYTECRGPKPVCRAIEVCNESGVCTLQAICLSEEESNYAGSYGCGDQQPPILERYNGSLRVRWCGTSRPCGSNGQYCSALLADASSRCCFANLAVQSPKAGTCRAPFQGGDMIFCVDECQSDADCSWGAKCCVKSTTCPKLHCMSPEPCSVKTCNANEVCVTDPDSYTAMCVPNTPPPRLSKADVYPTGLQQPSPEVALRCPHIYRQASNADCRPENHCGFPVGRGCSDPQRLCCFNLACGNICLAPVPVYLPRRRSISRRHVWWGF